MTSVAQPDRRTAHGTLYAIRGGKGGHGGFADLADRHDDARHHDALPSLVRPDRGLLPLVEGELKVSSANILYFGKSGREDWLDEPMLDQVFLRQHSNTSKPEELRQEDGCSASSRQFEATRHPRLGIELVKRWYSGLSYRQQTHVLAIVVLAAFLAAILIGQGA